MARTIKNDGILTIKNINASEVNLFGTDEIQIGTYYFEASRDNLNSCTIQIHVDNNTTLSDEHKEKIKNELVSFIDDIKDYGWDMLDIRDIKK